jgi:hypothetical protein
MIKFLEEQEFEVLYAEKKISEFTLNPRLSGLSNFFYIEIMDNLFN